MTGVGRGRPGWTRAATALVTIAVIIAGWEVAVRLSGAPVYVVPAPSDVVTEVWADPLALGGAGAETLVQALAGLVLGATVGLAGAAAATLWSQLEDGVLSVAIFVKSVPVIAVAPILTVWFGFGPAPKIAVTAMLTFFPVLVNALEGFRAVDPAVMAWLRSVDAGRRDVFRLARWPASTPFLFAALRVAGPLALVGAVVAEWIGGSSGLGRRMFLAYTNLDLPALFASVVVLTLLSAGVYRAVALVERRVLAYRRASGLQPVGVVT